MIHCFVQSTAEVSAEAVAFTRTHWRLVVRRVLAPVKLRHGSSADRPPPRSERGVALIHPCCALGVRKTTCCFLSIVRSGVRPDIGYAPFQTVRIACLFLGEPLPRRLSCWEQIRRIKKDMRDRFSRLRAVTYTELITSLSTLVMI